MVVRAKPSWHPLPRPDGITATEGYAKLPHVCFKNVEHIGLSVLSDQLSALGYDECLTHLFTPALLQQTRSDEGLSKLPTPLTTALAALPDRPVEVATVWGRSEEVRFSLEECLEVLEGLKEVATAASSDGIDVYLYTNL